MSCDFALFANFLSSLRVSTYLPSITIVEPRSHDPLGVMNREYTMPRYT
jgi:hypothetical protein